jgi:hypothetical protein
MVFLSSFVSTHVLFNESCATLEKMGSSWRCGCMYSQCAPHTATGGSMNLLGRFQETKLSSIAFTSHTNQAYEASINDAFACKGILTEAGMKSRLGTEKR